MNEKQPIKKKGRGKHMIISNQHISYNCRHSSHSQCKSRRKPCSCSCHPENSDPPRKLKNLRNVSIILKNYCSKCNVTHKQELHVCKNCKGLLRKVPNTKFVKKVYAHCMGTLESELYQRYREEDKGEDRMCKEVSDVYGYTKTKAWWTLRNENKIKRFLRSEKSSKEFLQKAGKNAVLKNLELN